MVCSMILLAGGKSSRMGRDKAELLYQGRRFLEIQLDKGKALGITDVLVSGYRGDCSAAVIPDDVPEQGPLGGILSCLRAAKEEWSLVFSVDTPLLPVEELRQLMDCAAHAEKPAVILHHQDREEPLMGMYHRSLIPVIEKSLAGGRRAIFHVLNETGYEVYDSSAGPAVFANVNDPDSYEAICQIKF